MKKLFSSILIVIILFHLQLVAQNEKPSTNLNLAVLQGNLDVVQQHIKFGSNLNEKDQFGSTPLIIAVTFGQDEIAKELIEAGADLSITNNEGSTPLHIASFFGRAEIVKHLLDNGAIKYARNNSGAIPLDIVSTSFEVDKPTYDKLRVALGPLGLKIDYEYIKSIRPQIAKLLKPLPEELSNIDFAPQIIGGWEISNPEDERLETELVKEFYFDASKLETLYSLLIIKNGKLIAEKYFNVGSIDQLSKRASVTKSYISAMMGIALANEDLKSVDQKMIEFFPELQGKITDPRKEQITIKQMLQMRAGYPWEETDPAYWDTLWTGRYINDIEDIPLTADPGTLFQYSNLTSNWLSMIITKASGTDLKTFGEEYLFTPLNVKIGHWNQDYDGYYIGSGDIEFTARDMAKFGLLYLDEGRFNEDQLIPQDWVKESLQNYSDDINSVGVQNSKLGRYFNDVGYGYQWWSATAGEHHFNFAWGHGGQLIVLLHDMDMVIVTTADSFWGKEIHFKSWKYEQSILNMVGKFIYSLPKENSN